MQCAQAPNGKAQREAERTGPVARRDTGLASLRLHLMHGRVIKTAGQALIDLRRTKLPRLSIGSHRRV